MSLETLVSSLSSDALRTAICSLCAEEKDKLTKYFSGETCYLSELERLTQCSEYALNQLLRTPSALVLLIEDLDIHRSFDKNALNQHLLAPDSIEETILNRHLRERRHLMMLRIIWRDLNRIASFEETTRELSLLAEIAIKAALNFHYHALIERFGRPRNLDGVEQPFIVLGMGKLGAYELNLSSDIDLIFCYPEKGHTDGADSIDNEDFFARLGKKLIHSLDTTSAEGRVFRVDMRLRPYGQSGTLVPHFGALEDYYQNQGREWERYAMVKARIVAATLDTDYNLDLMALLRNFTYRKYIDFSVIDALRKLKAMIRQEVRRRKLDDDIKLGSGGIREIEFIAQAFQLIRGGRDTELQDNQILIILPELERLQCLPSNTVEKLIKAYLFLRNSEHAIQAWLDAQTQRLPEHEAPRRALALAMGFDTWQAYLTALDQHRQFVSNEFDSVIGEESTDNAFSPTDRALNLWRSCFSDTLPDTDHADEDKCLIAIGEFIHSPVVQNLSANGKERLDAFMPVLLEALLREGEFDLQLRRILPLVRAIARRSAYMVLLIENPTALQQLIALTETSQQIADQLAKYPALLDELLDTRSLYSLPEKQTLENELQRSVLRIDPDDLEQQMETLRYFKLSHTLKIAACEVSGALPLMKVSDYLTLLAEVILDYCLTLVWNSMTQRHGFPDGRHTEVPDFVIIGYGKLGGIEMNHGSDLDLVFIHDANINGESNGEKPLDNQTFYMRLGQKLIHLLNTQTASGRLYEVDMRLRPSGNSGLLATTIAAFERYQEKDAWTWEHQALVRARAVAGSKPLAEKFATLRQSILCRTRPLPELRKDIVEMRHKMRTHLGTGSGEKDVFQLKQDAGGIVDIEFMVQYLVLAWSHAEPALATYTDNIRILEALAHTNKLSAQEVEQLIAAYKALRIVLHRRTIEQKSNVIDSDQLTSERAAVIKIWHGLLLDE